MSGTDLLAVSPLLVLAVTAVTVMLAAALPRRHGTTVLITQAGLVLALGTLAVAADRVPRTVTPLIIMDRYTLFFIGLIVAATMAVAALAYDYLARRARRTEEFYILLVTACLGACVLVAARHFAALFLGIELLSVPLFALIAYQKTQWRPLEAGVKYLILSGVSSAFLLFGMALVYAASGTLEFARVAAALVREGEGNAYLLAGVALILTGLGFKLSLVPFHMWVADVYEGAPAPVNAFIATVSKGAVFALLLRYFTGSGINRDPTVMLMISLMAVASMLVGNLLALLQNNVKRVLAYSSVAHVGYLLVAVAAGGELAVEAVGYYLAAYFVTMIGAFAVVALMSGSTQGDADSLQTYQGLFWRRPWLAGMLTAVLLSLAGIPVTMGFVAKFYVMAAGVHGALWPLVYVLIAASAIGLYYYLRIVIALYRAPAARMANAAPVSAAYGGGTVMIVSALLLVWLGLYPSPLIEFLHTTAATFP